MSELSRHYERVRALASSSRYLFVGGERAHGESVITVYDGAGRNTAQSTVVAQLEVPSPVHALVANEGWLVAGCADGMRLFQHDARALKNVGVGLRSHGRCLALALHEEVVLSGGEDGVLRLHRLKTGKLEREWPLSSRPLRAVAISAAGAEIDAVAAAGDDGVIRVVRLRDEGAETREMPGHDGAVNAIAFTPSDGRLVSAGDDGTVRVWYLSGPVDSEIRSKDDTLHVGGATALAFVPSAEPAQVGERVASVGVDGKIRIWRMSSRIKPRTLEAKDALYALTFLANGNLVAAGDARTLFGFGGVAAGEDDASGGKRFSWPHGFEDCKQALASSVATARAEAVTTLTEMREQEALDLLIAQLSVESTSELRVQIVEALARRSQAAAKKAVRARLDDSHATVRAAALTALRALEADTPLSPLRAALESRFADARVAALELLPALVASSPLASGLIVGRLADDDASVRRTALAKLVALFPERASEPLIRGFERGRADVRAEVLARAALAGLIEEPSFAPLVGKALDDDDAEVRRFAFVVTALTRPTLVSWLERHDEAFARALADFVARAAEALGKGGALPEGADADLAEVVQISAVFLRSEHPKLGAVAIFKPTLHTPVQVGDKIRLVGVKAVGPEGQQQYRADDYIVGGPTNASDEQLQELRAQLLPKASAETPSGELDRQPLLAALACRTPDTALRGARGLSLLGDMRALGALLTLSREADPALRAAAAQALVLGAVEGHDPRAKRRLVWMLNDGEASVRDVALRCVEQLESDPLTVAEAALHSAHEDIRMRGLDTLVKQGKDHAQGEGLLGDAIEDEASKVRGEAFRTLWSWHAEAPLVPVDRALVARFPDLRLRAVQELTTLAKTNADAVERLARAVSDRDLSVATAAYEAALEHFGKDHTATHLAAMASTLPKLRARGAHDARRAAISAEVRSALVKLLEDIDAAVRVAAIDTLDALLPKEPSAIAVGLQSSYLDLRVRTAELLAVRREEALINPMQALIADKELLVRLPPAEIVPLRQRAATALANLGAPRLVRYFASELIKDDDPVVREQAARGLSNASRHGEEGALLDLLGHEEIAIRSWAAEGLAKLGDVRALPVLIGTLRHEHAPIRLGAISSLTALGPEGYVGMLQGLEDPSRAVQRAVLSVILARDLRALRRGEAPDLLTSALSSQRPEVRFAAARALELRIVPESYLALLVEVLLPEKPEKNDETPWPPQEIAARWMVGLAEALASDRPEQRYAAAQALRLRDRPLEYFREVQRAVAPRSLSKPWVPDTAPRAPVKGDDKKEPLALLRRLFAGGADAADDQAPAESKLSVEEQSRLRLLAFGAYVGLLRQASEDDEAHRVCRDAIDRISELVKAGYISRPSATPALARALDDSNHLVRQAAVAALKTVYHDEPETALTLALASSSADVIRAALDQLAAGGVANHARIAQALDSDVAAARKYAFELLEKLHPAGSLEPLLAALASEHADIRIGVIERLATSRDARVGVALGKALESDHEDLRLRAAELLAQRHDERAVEALAPWLRGENSAAVERARSALAKLGAPAIRALMARLEDDDIADDERLALVRTIAAAGSHARAEAIDALTRLFDVEQESVRTAAFQGCVQLLGARADAPRGFGKPQPAARDFQLLSRFVERAIASTHVELRLLAAGAVDDVRGADASKAAALLLPLFGDRSRDVRTAAVAAYAALVQNARKSEIDVKPLRDVLTLGARETMLSAALGLAHVGDPAALRPLLLFARAGENDEPVRALIGLGVLGDARALTELETLATGGTEEAPAEPPQQAAALEALGDLTRALDADARDRVRELIESNVGAKDAALAFAAIRAVRGLGRAGDKERALATLSRVAGDETSDARVLAEVADAFGALEAADAPVIEALRGLLDHYDANVRWRARWALEALLPNDPTRVELISVESERADIAEPASSYLAERGDPGEVLAALPSLQNARLRQRLRFGLLGRQTIASDDLRRLLVPEARAEARADAAWIAGARANDPALIDALTIAATTAATRFAHARASGQRIEQEQAAWLFAVWALRRLDGAAGVRAQAQAWLISREVPAEIRAELALLLPPADLPPALLDPSVIVRSAAAARVVDDPLSLSMLPQDVVRLGRFAHALDPAAIGMRLDARQIFYPRTLQAHDALAQLAGDDDADRYEAIALLGRAASDEAIATLRALASEEHTKDEAVRKAAYRALRRAERARAKRSKSAAGGQEALS